VEDETRQGAVPETVSISVVVPHYNDSERLARLLERLKRQRASFGAFEVIVVDNGSTEGIVIDPGEPNVRLLSEPRRGSYAARNKGIREARGEIIALIDSDCLPGDAWLEEGLNALESMQADLVGGQVRFFFSGAVPSGAEFVDAVTHLQIEDSIRQRGVAPTANLFFRRTVVERIGEFPAELQSGGDLVWTRRATERGLKLHYAPRAEVGHPARRLGALLKKQHRVGIGQAMIARMEGQSRWRFLGATLLLLRPPLRSVPRLLRRGAELGKAPHPVRVWGALWAGVLATAAGRLRQQIAGPSG
jgi:glycosyltransferase AglE